MVEPLDARVGGVDDEEVVRQAVDARGDGNETRFALISAHTPHFAALPLSRSAATGPPERLRTKKFVLQRTRTLLVPYV